MMLLKEILDICNVISISGPENPNIDSIVFDSRKVGVNSLFVAIKGTQVDGHQMEIIFFIIMDL